MGQSLAVLASDSSDKSKGKNLDQKVRFFALLGFHGELQKKKKKENKQTKIKWSNFILII